MSCQPERVSEYLDGRLDASAEDTLLAHLATCSGCATAFAAARRARSLLARLATTPAPAVSPALLDRLSFERLALVGPELPPASHYRASTVVAGVAAAVVVAGAAWAASTGGAGPSVIPAVDRYRYEHIVTSEAGSWAPTVVVPVVRTSTP